MYARYFIQMEEQEQITNMAAVIARLLTNLDKRTLDLKYFESIRIDMSIPIDKADPGVIDNYKAIYYDSRRIASKSLKFLLDNKLISEKMYSLFIDSIINLLLQKPLNPDSIEIDPVNKNELI
jgi:hypothetical protein